MVFAHALSPRRLSWASLNIGAATSQAAWARQATYTAVTEIFVLSASFTEETTKCISQTTHFYPRIRTR